jgi:hypothetical protein
MQSKHEKIWIRTVEARGAGVKKAFLQGWAVAGEWSNTLLQNL